MLSITFVALSVSYHFFMNGSECCGIRVRKAKGNTFRQVIELGNYVMLQKNERKLSAAHENVFTKREYIMTDIKYHAHPHFRKEATSWSH